MQDGVHQLACQRISIREKQRSRDANINSVLYVKSRRACWNFKKLERPLPHKNGPIFRFVLQLIGCLIKTGR